MTVPMTERVPRSPGAVGRGTRMKTNLYLAIVVMCALGASLALPAKAEPPKKSKADASARSPQDPNLNWKSLKVTLGAPRVEGGTVPRIESALQKLNTPLSLCYSRSILHGARFRGIAGLTLWLSATGGVSNVRVAPPERKGLAQEVVTCWSNAARAAHFEQPSTEGVTVAFELQFSPEQGPPESPEPKAKYWGPVTILVGGQTSTSGAELPDAGRVVLSWGATLKPCAALARGVTDYGADGLLGLFRLHLTVAADGNVSNPSILPDNRVQPTPPDPVLQKAVACAVEHAKALHFAPRAGESEVQIGLDFRKSLPPGPARRD
jgi:hypothetical protein